MSKYISHAKAKAIITPFYNLFRADKRDWEAGFARLADDINVGVKFVEGYGVFVETKIPAEQVRTMCAEGYLRPLLGHNGHIYIKPYERNSYCHGPGCH